jgi:hypothetical protein
LVAGGRALGVARGVSRGILVGDGCQEPVADARSCIDVKRSVLLLVLMASVMLVAAACGEDGLLDGVGDRTQGAVIGTTTTTAFVLVDDVEEAPQGTVAATSVLWLNDGLEGEVEGSQSEVIARVFNRGKGNRFVQSSRAEMALVLPGIEFPRVVPRGVRWVTSQLVYDTASGTIDAGTSAAFGLWEVEPYTVDEGRAGVLRVGAAPEEQLLEIRAEVVVDGLSLTWDDANYRYELFCRESLPEDLCWKMAESSAPLIVISRS